MVKHITNINNNILTYDVNGVLGTAGIKTSTIAHTDNSTGSTGQIITADGDGGWSWSTPTGGASSLNDLTDAIVSSTNIGIGGNGTLGSLTDGINNIAVGQDTGTNITGGYSNILFGNFAGRLITSGNNNVAYGHNALNNCTEGRSNVAIGRSSGSGILTNYSAICIGFNSNVSSNSSTNEIVIGANVTGSGTNTVTIGTSSHSTVIPGGLTVNGNVGIGINPPTERLDVNGNLRVSGTANIIGSTFLGNTTSNIASQTKLHVTNGGIYLDGTFGLRMPRKGLYDSPGLREWWINQNISNGTGTSAINYLYSFQQASGGAGTFVTKHRLYPTGRGEFAEDVVGFVNFSDDRLKTNEMHLMNATESLLKLSVQTYNKEKVNNFSLLERTGEKVRETGLIAQEVYYNAPEFRHLINCGIDYNDENPEGTLVIPDEMDLSGVPIDEDPDYEGAGWSKTSAASINYQGFITYLIKSNQELHERIKVLEHKINI